MAGAGELAYDEFGLFRENVEEAGLEWRGHPAVERHEVALGDGRKLSALVWGHGSPTRVLLHGGAQNAHTWDTVALALDEPLVAVDLPGHGHSGWRDDHDYRPESMAEDVALAVSRLAPSARTIVGMSLGGLTAICLAAQHPELVRSLVIVDVTPGTDHAKAEPIIAFVTGPESFASFEEILERTVRYNPTRTVSSLRRGILHNARQEPDGSWRWRYDRVRRWTGHSATPGDRRGGERPVTEPAASGPAAVDFSPLWDALGRITAPMLLVRGALSGVVADEDVAELLRRQPGARVVEVEDAGHSVQGDRPVELARILLDWGPAGGDSSGDASGDN